MGRYRAPRTLFRQRMAQLGQLQNWRIKDPKNPEPKTPWRSGILECYDRLAHKLEWGNRTEPVDLTGRVMLITAPLELAKGGRMLESKVRVSGPEENYPVGIQQCAERKMLLADPVTQQSDLQRHEEALRTLRKGQKIKPPEKQVLIDEGLRPGHERYYDTWIFYTTHSPCRLCGAALAQGFGVWYTHLVVAFEGCYQPQGVKSGTDDSGEARTITAEELRIPDGDFFSLETDNPDAPGIEIFKVYRDPVNCELMREICYQGVDAQGRRRDIDWSEVPANGLPVSLPSASDSELRIFRVTRS